MKSRIYLLIFILSVLIIFFATNILSTNKNQEIFYIALGALFAIFGSFSLFTLERFFTECEAVSKRKNLLNALIFELKLNIYTLKKANESAEEIIKEIMCFGGVLPEFKVGNLSNHFEPSLMNSFEFSTKNFLYYKEFVEFCAELSKDFQVIMNEGDGMFGEHISRLQNFLKFVELINTSKYDYNFKKNIKNFGYTSLLQINYTE